MMRTIAVSHGALDHPSQHSQQRFQGIQILRGVSVAFTVMAHLPMTTAPFAAFGRPAPWLIGVAIFYAISGWIIAHVTRRNVGADIAPFLTRRLFRIVPVLLVSILMTIGFSVVLPRMPMVDQFYPDPWTALRAGLANLLFVSDLDGWLSITAPYSLLGLWSIAVEVKFYLIYASLLVLAPMMRPVALGVLLLLAAAIRWQLLQQGDPSGTSHVFFVELFCLGGISYRFRQYFRHFWLLSIAAWIWVIIFPIVPLEGGPFVFGYLALLASIVYIVNHAAIVTIPTKPGRLQHALIWLGERSYVLYVMHFQLLALAGLLGQSLALNFTMPDIYDLILLAGVFVGLPLVELIHQTVEKGGIRVGARVAESLQR